MYIVYSSMGSKRKYPKSYFKKKNHDNYERNKRISEEYQLSGHHGESYSDFKKRMKKFIK